MKKKTKLMPVDFVLLFITVGLIVFGIVMVFSASYYTSINNTGNPYSYLIKDMVYGIIGIGVMLFIAGFVDYRKLKRFGGGFALGGVVLLVLVFTPMGYSSHGATRWLNLGFTTIMPGEIAKLAIIIFTAKYLSERRHNIDNVIGTVGPLMLVLGVYITLIMMQPNMSTAMTVAFIMVAMLVVAGLNWKYFIGALAIGIVGIAGLTLTSEYRMERFTSFLNPFADPLGDGFQVCQSLLALGSGGLFGRGLGNSVQKTLYLPEPQNDFILAIIGEELGYIGIVLLMVVYVILIWRGIQIALRTEDRFGMLLASGIIMMIGIQVLLNIAVATSSMPPTGVTLPFVSYGGNALLLFCASMGILLNISRHDVK